MLTEFSLVWEIFEVAVVGTDQFPDEYEDEYTCTVPTPGITYKRQLTETVSCQSV